MSQEQDQVFFRNFSLVVAGIAGMMVLFYVAANFAGSSSDYEAEARSQRVAEITKPVGTVVADGEEVMEEAMTTEVNDSVAVSEAPVAEASGNIGETTYNAVCKNCHSMPAMAAMFPQTGDAAAWGPRIEKGIDTLYQHAIEGFVGDLGMMPAKGGNAALSDEEVKAAVDYIVSAVQ